MNNLSTAPGKGILYLSTKTFFAENESLIPRAYLENKKTYFVIKRAMDISISFLLLVFIGSWLFPLIATFILFDSPGPVFFRQKRVGKTGRIFMCIKFRTMVKNFEADHRQASKNDPRISNVGKFLRDSNLDELPQLVNVLLGEMSLVGPRPHMLSDCRRFSRVVKGYKFRTIVKPGITGLAQVTGLHGPTEDNSSIQKRFESDVNYIREASLLLDLKIIFHTALLRLQL